MTNHEYSNSLKVYNETVQEIYRTLSISQNRNLQSNHSIALSPSLHNDLLQVGTTNHSNESSLTSPISSTINPKSLRSPRTAPISDSISKHHENSYSNSATPSSHSTSKPNVLVLQLQASLQVLV